MNTPRLLDVARGSVEAFNDRDWDRFRSTLAPNSVYDEVGTGRKLTGQSEILDAAKGWTKTFPDVRGTIDKVHAADDTVVLEVTFKGTHNGELAGPTGSISPTGRHVTTRCVQVIRIADDLIVENRNYFDMLTMLQAVGAVPAAKKMGA